MKNLKHIIILLLITALPQVGFSQVNGFLTGIVKDEQGQPVGFANVALLEAADSVVINGTTADAEGRFQIKSPAKGTYFLRFDFLGYVQLDSDPFEVTGDDFTKDFGNTTIRENVQVLQEVVVQGMRPTVVSYADKMIVNVGGTAMAGGSTAYEVLAKSPGVWIDQNGDLKLNGKAGVKVMINNKLVYLSGKELQNFLQNMSGENIKDLEIITNPSAKYDAEGASGIININLKKSKDTGLNGSLHSSYQHNELNSYTAGADVNYKKGAWSAFANFDFAERANLRTNKMKRTFHNQMDSSLDQNLREEGKRTIPTLRAGASVDLNQRHSLGFMADVSIYNTENNISTLAKLADGNPEKDVLIDALNNGKGHKQSSTFNFHYLGKLDTMGTTLSADLDYVRLYSQDDATFVNRLESMSIPAGVSVNRLMYDNPNNYDIYAAKADLIKAVGKTGKLELGAKASRVISDNELKFYEETDGNMQPDARRSNHFIYKENILAAYASYSTGIGKKLNIQAGLRVEQTFAAGNSVTLSQKTNRNYFNLFPTLFLQHAVSDNYQISYSYSRRVNRPQYSALNPFIFYIDPYSWVVGNPYLNPQYTNAFNITQTINQRFNVVVGYTVTKDFIAEMPEQNVADKTTYFQQQNLEKMESFNTTLVAPLQVLPIWQMNNTATIMYQKYTAEREQQVLANEQVSFMLQSNHALQMPKSIRLELNAAYQGPAAYGLYRVNASWGVDAGLKRSFMNDKLDVSMSVTDIFKTKRMAGTINIDGNKIKADQYRGTQSFKISLRYRFSKGSEFKANKKSTNLDEVNRAGGK
ncbi:outer membrane beta-barrel family protein [Pontibacter cellulosilyticus]|uniref:TonB-dependent receptor n=1 Tax=Pontibacter cellulosilyticus TaxID=1720253 RepID=A0A923N3H9_9BACT|nr:outer membrane beta-barrel family protein [Pontibacter cellulosilyticus]MBC5992220.1 TonB-dependent receptor [Pontibacter cellulosilyticus]